MANEESINILKDDPFTVKRKLRFKFPKVRSKEIDLSRDDPFNPPDWVADAVFHSFLFLGIQLNKILGDRNIRSASKSELKEAKKILNGYVFEVPHSLMDETINEIIRINKNYRIKIDKTELLKLILSGVRGEDYSDVLGENPIRAIVADKLAGFIKSPPKEVFEPHEIILTLGAEEAIGAIFEIFSCLKFLEPKTSSVGMLSPIYPPYRHVVEKMNLKIHYIPSPPENGYEPTQEVIEEFKNVAPQIKVLLLIDPSIISSRALSSDVLKQLAEICIQNNIVVVADASYAPFVGESIDNILTYAPENTILIGSASKFYQETGMRFGYTLIIDSADAKISEIMGKQNLQSFYETESFREALVKAKGPDPVGSLYHTHFIPTPVQWMGAFRMLIGDPDARKFVHDLKLRWETVYEGFGLRKPEEKFPGAKFVPYSALIDFYEVCRSNNFNRLANAMHSGRISPEEFIEKLYSESHVLGLPSATCFPESPEKHIWKIRFSVGDQKLERIEKAVDSVVKMLKKWDKKL